jgi:hypothetical protein
MPLDTLIEGLAPLIALFGVGTFVLIGMRMRLQARASQHERMGQADVSRLTEAVGRLSDEMDHVRGDIEMIHERLDFAERLLTRGQQEHRGQSTPA